MISFLLPYLLFSVGTAKELVFDDRTYEPQIKTVQVFPGTGSTEDRLQPAASPLNNFNLNLEFDDLQNDLNNYYAKIIHCNVDWTKSSRRDLDFLSEYNEFRITGYQYSNNTHLPYVHYSFPIPKVKLPGNYLIIVYREGDMEDLVLSHRFLVFDNKVFINGGNDRVGSTMLRATNQQLNFIIDYSRTDIFNALESVLVVIRQNNRWDNAKTGIKPSFVREGEKQLEYRFFDTSNEFQAGNEFRFVDFRSVNFPGQNVATVDRRTKPFHLYVATDQTRSEQPYALYTDINGKYSIENNDPGEALTSSQYINVHFSLRSKSIDGEVFLSGAFNNWQHNDETKMQYENGAYTCGILLKQGFYNYQYWVTSTSLSPFHFEGSRYETENLYEILVYYKSFQNQTDLLIGYFKVPVNPR